MIMEPTESDCFTDEFALCRYGLCTVPIRYECDNGGKAGCTCKCHNELAEDIRVCRTTPEPDEALIEAEIALSNKPTGAFLRIYTTNPIREEHLKEVIIEMQKEGSPAISCAYVGGEWYAIDGSHRLAAAKELGLKPFLFEHHLDERLPEGITAERKSTPIPIKTFGDAVTYYKEDAFYEFEEPIDISYAKVEEDSL